MSRTVEIEAADWIARQDSDTWSDDRARELEAWLTAETAHRVAYLRLRAAWDRADRLGALNGPNIVPPAHPTTVWRRPAIAIVAGLTALALAGALSWTLEPRPTQKTYSTQRGGHETISLADGSRLVLNTSTRLRANVTATSRVVRLDQGEAFFDVTHDPAHPFVVIAGDRRITDLGTRFSVRRDGHTVKVVVEDGRVRIEPSSPAGHGAAALVPIIVARGGVAVADARAVLVVHRSDVQLTRDLSWREGLLSFSETTLAEAAAEFNRYNDKKLVIDDPATANIRIDGVFRSDNTEGFARLLRAGFGLTVQDDGAEIHISG